MEEKEDIGRLLDVHIFDDKARRRVFDYIADLAERASARIAALEAERRWIPVEEKLPRLDDEIDFAAPAGLAWLRCYGVVDEDDDGMFVDSVGGEQRITAGCYWKPASSLPEPPK